MTDPIPMSEDLQALHRMTKSTVVRLLVEHAAKVESDLLAERERAAQAVRVVADLQSQVVAKDRALDRAIKERDEYLNGLTATAAQLAQAQQENRAFEDNFSKRESHWIRENAQLQQTISKLSAPVTAMEWSLHCDQSSTGIVKATNGIAIVNALLAARREGQ